MRPHLERRLHTLAEEIAAADAEAAMLRDRLAAQHALVEERRLEALVAETPQADRDLHVAAHDLTRVEARLASVDGALVALRAEASSLAGRATVGA